MTTTTFAEWVEYWGEPHLVEVIADSQKCYREMWDERNDGGTLWSFPAWELCLGTCWQESLVEWHSRWQHCGGRLCDGRMIAAKWDEIWARLSSTFYDGLGYPYPPYARSSCAYWSNICQDEVIVTGAISESEFEAYMARVSREPLEDLNVDSVSIELLEAAGAALEDEIHRLGGPPPGATRAERVTHQRKQREESFARAQAEYEERNRERNRAREEQNAVFRLLEQVEESLRELPSVHDPRRWEWLCTSVKSLTTTLHFDRYPNWRARAWLACAELHKIKNDPAGELVCLEHALSINDKLPIKRRIKNLKNLHESA